MFIPGGISPAAVTYGPLLEVLKDEVRPVLKDPEAYAAETPPPGYELEWGIESIKHIAKAAGMAGFHPVEYSNGLSLAFTAKYPEWVRSLANPGSIPAKILIILTPPGSEGYWEEMAQHLATDTSPDPALVLSLQQKYHLETGGQVRQFSPPGSEQTR
jgi:hypothetical protein